MIEFIYLVLMLFGGSMMIAGIFALIVWDISFFEFVAFEFMVGLVTLLFWAKYIEAKSKRHEMKKLFPKKSAKGGPPRSSFG